MGLGWMKKLLTPKEAYKILHTTQTQPTWFWENVLACLPWEKQIEILASVWANPKTAVRSCHGAGKSWTAARIGITYLMAWPDSIVLTTAPTGRQVREILWQEWRKAVGKAKYNLGQSLQVKHQITDGWYAFGFATDIPDNLQGIHASSGHILVIVDEGAGVAAKIFVAVDALLVSADARLLVIGNPTDPVCLFADLFNPAKNPGVNRIKISAFDTPNFLAFGITEADIADGTWESKITSDLPMPWLVTPAWVADKYRRWGPDSPMYVSRVKGDFPVEGDNVLIPLAWVEAAMERWHDMEEGLPVELGVDIARYGSDESAIAKRAGHKVCWLKGWRKHDLMETAGWILRERKDNDATEVKIDIVGMGSGVYDRLNEQGEPVVGVDVNKAPHDKEQFNDRSSELWWTLRALLDPNGDDPIGLPDDEELMGQLSSRKYSYTSQGKVKIESKDEMKARGLGSPDRGDAVTLVYAKEFNVPASIVIPTLGGTSRWR